ncbi:hypothetical protein HN748_03875 [Candidatus Peregrinibacteria bacterium]|jgi:hypothetical protein|nr:hypothetical protein [Candidatus Peregrinibacteria bacterium]MBT7484251.1 hypothetical protein [Candidatus Peregrinibacteria bacterium]MBT7703348.1 hypothetical protein [Candidatus Peregrinibacteria bacterium]
MVDILHLDDEAYVSRKADKILTEAGADHMCFWVFSGSGTRVYDTESDTKKEVPLNLVAGAIDQVAPGIILSDQHMKKLYGTDLLEGLDPERLMTREEVLSGARLEQEKLIFMIHTGGFASKEVIEKIREALKSGKLAFLFEKTRRDFDVWETVAALVEAYKIEDQQERTHKLGPIITQLEAFHQAALQSMGLDNF